MRRHLLALCCFLGCGGEPPKSGSLTAADVLPAFRVETPSEVEFQIQLATHYACSLGGEERRRAIQWVVEHPQQTHTRVIELVESGQPLDMASTAEVLARMGRPESVPVLERVLSRGEELTAWDAANGLARHPSVAAREALVRNLDAPAAYAVTSAADALGNRGEKEACGALAKKRTATNESIRYHVVRAAGRLGCLSPAELPKP